MRVKIKNTNGTKGFWDNTISMLSSLGCEARDNDYRFNPEKPSIVVENGRYIIKSRTDYTPKKQPYADEISMDDFRMMSTVKQTDFLRGRRNKQAGCNTVEPLSSSAYEVYKVTYDGYDIPTFDASGPSISTTDIELPCAQETLKVKKADVLVQNSIIFRTQTIPYLRDHGIDVTEDDGKYYILDIEKNEAVELTPEYVKEKAEADLLNDDVTVWTKLVREFDLINKLTMTKRTQDDK